MSAQRSAPTRLIDPRGHRFGAALSAVILALGLYLGYRKVMGDAAAPETAGANAPRPSSSLSWRAASASRSGRSSAGSPGIWLCGEKREHRRHGVELQLGRVLDLRIGWRQAELAPHEIACARFAFQFAAVDLDRFVARLRHLERDRSGEATLLARA